MTASRPLLLLVMLCGAARAVAQQGGTVTPPPPPAAAPATAAAPAQPATPALAAWPALEPFKESRFWDLASETVREQGLTTAALTSMEEEFAALRDSKAEADAAVADMFGGKPPKDLLLGTAVPEERKIWFWEVPIVLDALGPLWSSAAWDDAQLARGKVAAAFFARQKGPPPLAFAAGQDAGNHAQLEQLVAWFRAESARPESYALMIVTDDDGPWLPQKAKRGACKSADSQALDDHRTLVVCRQDKKGDPWRLQLMEKGKEIWTRTLTQVPSDEPLRFAGDPTPLGSHGWIVPMDFGEYTAVYLDAQAELIFYFTSW